MATQAISAGSLGKIRTLVQQWEATHGRRATPDIIQGLMEAELSQASQRQAQAFQQEMSAESMRQAKENELYRRQEAESAAKKAERAAMVKGVIDVGQAGGTAAMGAYQTFGPAIKGAAMGAKLGASGTGTMAGGTGSMVGSSAGGTGAVGSTVGGVNIPAGAAVQGGGVTSTGTLTTSAPSLGTTGGQAGVTSAMPSSVGTGTSAGSGTGTSAAGGGVPWTGVGIAAAVIADAKIARGASGPFESMSERMRANAKAFEYGGVSPGAASLMQKHGVKSPLDITKDITGVDIGGSMMQLSDQITKATIPSFVNDFMDSLGF